MIVLQIIKSKARRAWPFLASSIFLLFVGLLLMILSDEIVEIILAVALSAVLFVYGTVRMIACWRRNKLTHQSHRTPKIHWFAMHTAQSLCNSFTNVL